MKTPSKVPHLVWHWNPAQQRPEKFSPVPYPSLAEALAAAKGREFVAVDATTGQVTETVGVHRTRMAAFTKAIGEHFLKFGVQPSTVPAPATAPASKPTPTPAAPTTRAPKSPAIAPPPLARPEPAAPARIDLLDDDDAAEEDDAYVAPKETRTPTEPIRFTAAPVVTQDIPVRVVPASHPNSTARALGDDLTEVRELRAPALNEALTAAARTTGTTDVDFAAKLSKALEALYLREKLEGFCGERLDGLFSLLVAADVVGGCEKATELLRMLHKQFGEPIGDRVSG